MGGNSIPRSEVELPDSGSPPAVIASSLPEADPSWQSQSPVLEEGQTGASGSTSFSSAIVGRQFQRAAFDAVRIHPGSNLEVHAEDDNPRDKNALLVTLPKSEASDAGPMKSVAVGHLPAVVARHLGPLIRKGIAVAEVIVASIPTSSGGLSVKDKSPLPIEVHVSAIEAPGISSKAAGAAIRGAVSRIIQEPSTLPQSTGERLRHNFKQVVDTVLQYDGHVLGPNERSFIRAFDGLSVPASCLFLRLFMRCGPVFSLNSLLYVDVPDAKAAAEELERADVAQLAWCGRDNEEGFAWSDIAKILTVPKLNMIVTALTAPPAMASKKQKGRNLQLMPRATALESIRQRAESHVAAVRAITRQHLLSSSGAIVRLHSKACLAVNRLQRLFFLNEGHSLAQFLATDSGTVRYPRYCLTRKRPVFLSAQQFCDYERALKQAEHLTIALENDDLNGAEAALLPAWQALDASKHKRLKMGDDRHRGAPLFLLRYNAAWVYCLMATAGVSLLERQKRFKEAVERLQQLLGGCFCNYRRGLWWLRLSTNLEHLGRSGDALEIAETALADESLRPGDRLSLQRRVLRLGKPPRRWKAPSWAANGAAQREPREVRIEGRPLNSIVGLKSRFYGFNDEQCGVEELALQYYATAEGGGWPRGVHTEGGVWATLFGLILWPALFDVAVEDAFRSPFQTAPLDLDGDEFYASRVEVIEKTLADVAAGAASALMAGIWKEHHGALCRGVNWERWRLEELQEIAECVGGPGLAAVCRLLAQDHGAWQGGMPDLLLWHPENVAAKLVEVKGPRDRLSDQQRAWISALEDSGLDVEVLKVVEPNSNGKKKKS